MPIYAVLLVQILSTLSFLFLRRNENHLGMVFLFWHFAFECLGSLCGQSEKQQNGNTGLSKGWILHSELPSYILEWPGKQVWNFGLKNRGERLLGIPHLFLDSKKRMKGYECLLAGHNLYWNKPENRKMKKIRNWEENALSFWRNSDQSVGGENYKGKNWGKIWVAWIAPWLKIVNMRREFKND